MKKILIAGANSYIGMSFENYLKPYKNDYYIDTIDLIDGSWKERSFAGYDAVFHVAGIVHIKETSENAHLYYEVNRDLTTEVAEKAKSDGVKQFIYLSSMSVYGVQSGVITSKTELNPKNNYGKSKLEGEQKLEKLRGDDFKVVVLRPPMVYGKDCKGNYRLLRAFAIKFSIFPSLKNERSMIYIGNLCEFVKQMIDDEKDGLFCPQNSDYVCTREMVDLIASQHSGKIFHFGILNPIFKYLPISLFKKVFGVLVYEKNDVVSKYSFEQSIYLSEKEDED